MTFSTIAYAAIVGIVPSFIWLVFWLREDVDHPEPRWLILLSFMGGFLAVLIAILAEQYIAETVTNRSICYTLWAALEEIIKFIIISGIALNSFYNDEPIDAMIYMITIALGFTAAENALFVLEPLSSGQIAASIVTGGMRFVGATVVHIVCSAIVGFSLGFMFYRSLETKIISVIFGLITAIALHTIFNLSIINSTPSSTIKIFAWIWIAVVVLIILFEEIKAVRPRKIQIQKA